MRIAGKSGCPQTPVSGQPSIDGFRAQHLVLAEREIAAENGPAKVTVDENESPLAWLARRRGRDGRAMIEPHQLQAGERLRADFTRALLMPRTSSNWSNPLPGNRQASGPRTAVLTETIVAAKQRVRHALDAVGPEFAGLLLDVCCFLKGLEVAERERAWPARSAKVVLQLALDRLARHYGYGARTRGPATSSIRTWLSDGAHFTVTSD
ncbi:MAG TPA: DUF6456 domain-containing protein [Pseudolabrys sp.]|jgi:hypothetical protein